MKKISRILFILCLLAALVCIVSTTAFAETDIALTEADVSVAALVVGDEFPTPTVAENTGYSIKSYSWKEVDGSTIRSATSPVEVKRYRINIVLAADTGYAFQSGGNWTVNGEPVTNEFNNDTAYTAGNSGELNIHKTFSLRTPLDRVEVTIGEPVDGTPASQTPVTSAEPDKYTVYIRDVLSYGQEPSSNYKEGLRYDFSIYVTATDGYEYTHDCTLIVNGQLWSTSPTLWYSHAITYEVNLNQTVEVVELPAFPETVLPGPGGTTDLTTPENAAYTLQQTWIDMRTGQPVQTLTADDVYTLAYVATPAYGYFFRDETVFTQNGEVCQVAGDEKYAVIYKSYDLGAQKIDRVDVTLPQLKKGCTPGAGAVPAGVNYSLWEIIWAESTTDSFEDALPVQVASFGTKVYAVPVLCAAPGYTFSEDVKLYFNGVEVTVEDLLLEGPVLEIAGLYGTLTPPSTDGWHEEDNTWAYYENGQKRINAWIADSIGWCYVGGDGLMLTNGWAQDSIGWCYLGADGYMVKNRWAKDSVGWCYLDGEGYMVYNKWIRDSIDWCYVGADGYMLTNAWVTDSKGWCYVGDDGYMVRNSWAADSVGICRLDKDGYIVYDQWIHDGQGWLYIDKDGYLVLGDWVQYKGDWYAMGTDGYMIVNSWITYQNNVYRMGSDGIMLTSQWVHDGYGWSYVNQDGIVPFESWVKDSGGTCYIGPDGYMLRSCWIKIDDKRYYVDENGHMLRNTTRTFTEPYPYMKSTYKFDSNGVATYVSLF